MIVTGLVGHVCAIAAPPAMHSPANRAPNARLVVCRFIVVSTPVSPTGKVFNALDAALAQAHRVRRANLGHDKMIAKMNHS
ncbi:MAG: hypothetical protein ACLGJD_03525 [Gammaproteobacteria bacterium]